MSLTKEKAWIIFRADKLGQPEAEAALKGLLGTDWGEYHLHAEEFDLELAKIGIEAQNEAAAIMENYPQLKYLEDKKPFLWDAGDYISVVRPFKGSKFETLHLSAMFGVPNAELLLELVKP